METTFSGNSIYDSILEKYIGNDGRWQRYHFGLLLLLVSTSAYQPYLHLFSAYTPKHRCFVPGCDSDEGHNPFETDFNAFALPPFQGIDFLASSASTFAYGQCEHFARLDPNSRSCLASDFSKSDRVKCERFVYDNSVFSDTMVTELDLVCDQAGWAKFISTGIFVGLLIGSLIGGRMSDRLGRCPSGLLAVLVILVSVLLPAAIGSHYWTFWVCRALSNVGAVILWMTTKSSTVEILERKERMKFMVIHCASFYVSLLLLPLLAYFERSWQMLHVYTGLAIFVVLPPVFYWLDESPRWLALNAPEDKSLRLIISAAKGNGKILSSGDTEEVKRLVAQMRLVTLMQQEHRKGGLGILDMFNSWHQAGQTIVLMLLWIITIVTGYGLAFAMQNLAGDVFLNFSLISGICIFGNLFINSFLDKLGRRWTVFLLLLVTGMSCCIAAFVDSDTTILILALTSRLSSNALVNMTWLITGELYPTNMRGQAMGLCSASARIFGLLAPYIASLSELWHPLGFLALGSPALLVAGFTFFLPETRQMALQDDIKRKRQDVEMEGKELST